MKRGSIWLGAAGCTLLGYAIGRALAPAPLELPDPAGSLTESQLESAIAQAIREPVSFDRARVMIRLLEEMSPENVVGASRVLADHAERWDPVDLQIFLSAWVRFDPVAALSEIQTLPSGSRRDTAIRIAVREWAASGRWLEATEYVQTSPDPEFRGIAAGPLVRGWALAGEHDAALAVARRLWASEDRMDVVDGYVRGMLQVGAPEDVVAVALRVDPEVGGFDRRLVEVTLYLVGHQDPVAAAELYERLVAKGESAWLEGALPRLALGWSNRDPRAALDWLMSLSEGAQRTQALGATMNDWAKSDFEEAWAWLLAERSLSADGAEIGDTDGALLKGILVPLARRDPALAAGWAERLPADDPRRLEMLIRVAQRWSDRDSAAALAWVEGLPLAPERRGQVARAVADYRAQRPSPAPAEPGSAGS